MKKILILFLFVTPIAKAQFFIKGEIYSPKKYDWALLYKLEGARQLFVKKTEIKSETQRNDRNNSIVGFFEFSLPAETKNGTYRIAYDPQKNGFVDFLFNKENVEFAFNSEDVQGTIDYVQSKENQLYQKYLRDISLAQYKVDSIQVTYLKNASAVNEQTYTKAVKNISQIQQNYNENARGTLAYHFIKATDRYNAPSVAKNSREYLQGVVTHFFDNIDFSDPNLNNSSFLTDRIADYVFYINYSQDQNEQLTLHKKAVDVAISKIDDVQFRSDVIQFLISQFAAMKNAKMVDYLFENQFDKLPTANQDPMFRKKMEELKN